MKSFILEMTTDDLRDLVRTFATSHKATIHSDENNELVASFTSSNWEIGQTVLFQWLSKEKSSQLQVKSDLTSTNKKIFENVIKSCTIIMLILFILLILDVVSPFFALPVAFVLFGIAILDGFFLVIHGQAENRLIRYLGSEFDRRNIIWRTESETTRSELAVLTAAAIVVSFVLLAITVLFGNAPWVLFLPLLGLSLVFLLGRRGTRSGMLLWKNALTDMFVTFILLAAVPTIHSCLSTLSLFIPGLETLSTVLFSLLIIFFVIFVIPQNVRMREKEFGESFWVGARREYQQILEKTGDEIHALEYFGIWVGLNLMVISWVVFTFVFDRFWFLAFMYPELLFDMGFSLFLEFVIVFPLLILIFSWIKRSAQSFRLCTHMREPTSKTCTIASKIFEELHIANVQVKSYGSSFVNGAAVYLSPISRKGIILVSSAAEKRLNDMELQCLIMHECGHILNDRFMLKVLTFMSRFSLLGESLFALSVNMVRVEENADLFAAKKVGKKIYSEFLLKISVINTLRKIQEINEPPLIYCFLQPLIPDKVESKGLAGLYEMYKHMYSTLLGGGIVGYIHPSFQRRIEVVTLSDNKEQGQ